VADSDGDEVVVDLTTSGTARLRPGRGDSGATATLWREYRDAPGPRTRDQLVLHYAGLVKYVVGRVAAGLPGHVARDEMVNSGLMGLVGAIERFEPGSGATFESYAVHRIRGAVLDGLRRADWVPRSARTTARAIEQAHARLEARLHRSPSEAELAGELGMRAGDLRRALDRLSLDNMASLDAVVLGDEGSRTGSEPIDLTAGPEELQEAEAERLMVVEEVALLPDRERQVLALYYYEGLTLAQIGSVLGVTESRVSQIHTQAVLHLRSRLTRVEA